MQQVLGTLTAKTAHKQLVRSPTVRIGERVRVELRHNDVPVTLYYRHGNYPWRSMLINDTFREAGIPQYSDIYLMCSVAHDERVDYNIEY